MDHISNTKRLADATTALAATILEIINEKLEAATAVQEQKIARKMIEPILTKKQAAEHFQVAERTIEIWMDKGYLPHYRIGRMTRIKLSDVESWWNERHMVRRRRRFF